MESNKNTQRLSDLKEIAIVIDTWDDVFSDFDPRPLGDRTVSGDFIEELKKRYRETRAGDFSITIYAPVSLRDDRSERMVVSRLKKHFRLRYLENEKGIGRRRVKGAVLEVIGVFSLTFLTVVTYFKLFGKLAIEILNIFFMPLGWFGMWEGLSRIVNTPYDMLQERLLYNKLSKAGYKFKYIEP